MTAAGRIVIYPARSIEPAEVGDTSSQIPHREKCKQTNDCEPESLLCRLAEYVDGDAIDKAVDGCLNKIQGAKKPEGASGLLQALLGQAAEFRQPRLH